MHLLYLDESGGVNDSTHRYFVLAGVLHGLFLLDAPMTVTEPC